MGIDIYMQWRGQTEKEKQGQITGFSIEAGRVGYLREAYHGGPYVTRFLVGEAFAARKCGAAIPAAKLRERLPAAVMLAIYREHIVYGEAEKTPGFLKLDDVPAPTDMLKMISGALMEAKSVRDAGEESNIASSFNTEQLRAAKALIKDRKLPKYALSFVDFVILAERKEAETGKPVMIHASY